MNYVATVYLLGGCRLDFACTDAGLDGLKEGVLSDAPFEVGGAKLMLNGRHVTRLAWQESQAEPDGDISVWASLPLSITSSRFKRG